MIAQLEASHFVMRTSNGVSVMRSRFSYRSPGSGPYRSPFPSIRVTSDEEKAAQAEAARVAAAERARLERFEPSKFTETELIALISASERLRHQAVFHGIRYRDKLPPIPFPVLVGLKERGFIEKRQGERFFKLTEAGRAIADKVADHIVKIKDLHESYGHHEKVFSYESAVFCTCGWLQNVSTFNFQSNARRAFSSHLRYVEQVKVEAS